MDDRGTLPRAPVRQAVRPQEGDSSAQDLQVLGQSRAFAEVVALIRRLAPTDATILVHGETGTGKELVARAIHYWSDCRRGPFIPVNCGALPDALVESELFGHVRGAFTDAREANRGLIDQANGGTLFLDELEALAPRGQVALLRFLQGQEYRPVGGTAIKRANVRIVGATNADLGALVVKGAFREDLLFRLSVLAVDLPPLRVRGDDVVLLAEAFLDRLGARYGRAPCRLTAAAVSRLRAHHWPGNVRELENLMHREVLLARGTQLDLDSLAPLAGASDPVQDAGPNVPLTQRSFKEAKAQAVAAFERAYIEELLVRAQGNVSLAARLAGKERSRLGRLIRKHGLSRAAFACS